MGPGDTPAQGAVRNVRRELKLEVAEERFEVIANYSFVWHTRAQAPMENGTADLSTVMNLEVTEEEASRAVFDKDEYEDARWFDVEEVLKGEFHPALKQAIQDLRAKKAYQSLVDAVAASDADERAIATAARALVHAGAGAPARAL